MSNVNLNPDTAQAALNRRRQLALALQAQSMAPIESPQMPGAKISPIQGIAKLLEGLAGTYQNRKLDKEQSALTDQTNEQRLAQALALSRTVTPQGPGSEGNINALAQALASSDPMMQKSGEAAMQNQMISGREANTQQAEMARLLAGQGFTAGQNDLSRGLTQQQIDIQRQVANQKDSTPVIVPADASVYDRETGTFNQAPKTVTPPAVKPEQWEPDKVMVDGIGTAVLRNPQGMYLDANTRKPITGRITPYITPPSPRQKGEITPTAEAGLIQNLSKQWQTASKDVADLYRSNTIMQAGLQAARKGDLNSGSQAVLVTFQKFLDPTSVVRESEYARSGAGQSMYNRVSGAIEKLSKGGAGMTLPELEKFAEMGQEIANNLNKEGASLLSAERKRIEANAKRYDIPLETIIPDYRYEVPGGTAQPQSTAPAAPTPPKIGEVRGGYKYMGGDPSKQENWKK